MIEQAKAYVSWELAPARAQRSRGGSRGRRRPRGDAGYSRDHQWLLGGTTVPMTDRLIDVPHQCSSVMRGALEEAFAAAVGASHMMAFLALAVELGVTVTSYRDAPTAVLSDMDGEWRIIEIVLNPEVTYGEVPATPAAEQHLHEQAKLRSALVNSVNAKVSVYSAAEFKMAAS
jgi:organic hydroperoxide reductase OsmC/OhrA